MHREHGFDHVSLRTVVSLRLLVAPAALADAQKEHRTKAQVLTRPPVGAWSTARRAASAGIRRGLLESRVSLIGGKRPGASRFLHEPRKHADRRERSEQYESEKSA